MTVHSVIRKNAVDLTLVRRVVTHVGGYAKDTDTSSTVKGVIQPMSPKELRNVPEGQNTLEWRNVWSETELRNRDLITDPEGNQFTLQSVEFWREGIFYKATAVEAGDGAVS